MDGDRMGELLRHAPSGANTITTGLTTFARQVPDMIDTYNGTTVYAGGDDVLAFMPVDHAVVAACRLADAYTRSFADAGLPPEHLDKATLSGAIVFAHYGYPLRSLIREAHRLLDEVAKDATGRASLALSIYGSNGELARWAAPWRYLVPSMATVSDAGMASTCLGPLLTDIKTDAVGKSVFYRLRLHFSRFLDADAPRPGEPVSIQALCGDMNEDIDQLLCDLFAAEIQTDRERERVHGGDNGDQGKLRMLAKNLLTVCRHVRRNGNEIEISRQWLCLDGARIAYFLATGGMDDQS